MTMLLYEFAEELQKRGYKNRNDYDSEQLQCLITLAKQKPEVFYDPEKFLLIELESDRRSVFLNWCHQDRESSLQFLRLAEHEYQKGSIDSTIRYLLINPFAGSKDTYEIHDNTSEEIKA